MYTYRPILSFSAVASRGLVLTLLLVCGLGLSAPVLATEGRVALVIGNAAYKQAPLRNPVNDARDVAEVLRTLGFEVVTAENATKAEMQLAVLEFSERLRKGRVGLFYYAGHAIQVGGHNYLIPVNADFNSELEAKFTSLDVNLVLDSMGEGFDRINLAILDACRNNPFERRFRGASRGLVAIDAAQGTMIAYSTAPGSVAADGDGRNGLYTEEFLKAVVVPGLKVEEVFKRVRIGVSSRSGHAQIPWESSSLTGDFVFNLEGTVSMEGDHELAFWNSIEGSERASHFEAYLKQFPDGTFAHLARSRIADIEDKQSEKQLSMVQEPETIDELRKQKERLERIVQETPGGESQDGATTPPYKIAFFPLQGGRGWSSPDKGVVRSVTRYINRNNLLTLSFSFYSDPSESVQRAEVWSSPKVPNLEAVLAHARELGVQGVVMGSISTRKGSSAPRFKLELYLIDVSQGSVIESEGESDLATSVARKAFSDFLASKQAASQVQ